MPQSIMTKTYALYLRMGIIPRIVRGNWKDGDYMYSHYYDDVQYTIDDFGDYEIDIDATYLLDCLEAREMLISRHHALIKEVYNYIKTKTKTHIWVRVNAGAQLNCTFGDNLGEVAHLRLDFVDDERKQEAVQRLQELLGIEVEVDFDRDNFTLIISDAESLEMFKEYENPSIEVVFLGDLKGGH